MIFLNEDTLLKGVEHIATIDDEMRNVVHAYGPPPLWAREASFGTLVHIILEQQVSLASANAAFHKLTLHMDHAVLPEPYLQLDDEVLKAMGLSRQKMRYTRALAEAVLSGSLDLVALHQLPDDDVRTALCALPGIGNWTSDIYLSECLMRPDILPPGDIAMQEAFKVLKGLESRPNHALFVEMTEHWRPWRSVGSRLLWHFYLSERKKK
jgi:DNA-3-methyladenine glycosylase II